MRAHRQALGISVAKLAAKLGVSGTLVYYWEYGQKLNSPLFLEKKADLLEILGCKFEDLNFHVPKKNKTDRKLLYSLKFFLEEKDMKRKELMAICNLSRAQVANYINLVSGAPEKDAERIAYVLGVSVEELYKKRDDDFRTRKVYLKKKELVQSSKTAPYKNEQCFELNIGSSFDLLVALRVKSFKDLEKRTGLEPDFLAKLFSSIPVPKMDVEKIAIALGVPLGYVLKYHDFRFVCDKLWKILRIHNVSASELAKMIGSSKEIVQKIVDRALLPTMFDAQEIAKALGVKTSEIGHPYCYLDKIGMYRD